MFSTQWVSYIINIFCQSANAISVIGSGVDCVNVFYISIYKIEHAKKKSTKKAHPSIATKLMACSHVLNHTAIRHTKLPQKNHGHPGRKLTTILQSFFSVCAIFWHHPHPLSKPPISHVKLSKRKPPHTNMCVCVLHLSLVVIIQSHANSSSVTKKYCEMLPHCVFATVFSPSERSFFEKSSF